MLTEEPLEGPGARAFVGGGRACASSFAGRQRLTGGGRQRAMLFNIDRKPRAVGRAAPSRVWRRTARL